MLLNLIQRFCEQVLGNEFSTKRISEATLTYEVVSKNKKYILKVVNRTPEVFGMSRKKGEMKAMKTATRLVRNSCKKISTINIIAYREYEDMYIYLIKSETLEPFVVAHSDDYRLFAQALKEWHKELRPYSDKIQRVPWNNFSPVFKNILEKNYRWDAVLTFLAAGPAHTRQDRVICHNDIHAGNVHLNSDKKIILLDIDDMGVASYCNDLGMILANYWLRDSKKSLLSALDNLIEGYFGGKKACSPRTKENILKYALKKLYYTEAYYLYRYNESAAPDVLNFIKTLRQRERIVENLLSSTVQSKPKKNQRR